MLEARFQKTATVEQVTDSLVEHGYAIIENYRSPEDVARKKADLQRVLGTVPKGRNDFEGFATQRIYAFFAKTRTFDDAALDPLLQGALDNVLGKEFVLSAPVGINIGPGETAQRLHRDENFPVKRPHQELIVNSMWALDDFTEANGATRVVPGSHKWVDKVPDDTTATVQATMPAGSVMFFVGSIFHSGGANTTDKARLGVILHCCAGWVRPQENHLLGVPKEIVRELDPRLQQMLGYGMWGNLHGNVDGRYPTKYLDDHRAVVDGVLADPNAPPS